MNQLLKLKNIAIIIIILVAAILIVLGIRFIHYQNIQYRQSIKETVVEEEVESKISKDEQVEKELIKPEEYEEYEEKDLKKDTLMIF